MKCQTNQFNCPVEATLSLIGGKYKPLILWHLIDHPLHYMELQRLIPNATPMAVGKNRYANSVKQIGIKSSPKALICKL